MLDIATEYVPPWSRVEMVSAVEASSQMKNEPPNYSVELQDSSIGIRYIKTSNTDFGVYLTKS